MFEKVLIISELHYDFAYISRCVQQLKKLGTESCLLVQCLNPHELNDTVSTYVIGLYKEHLTAQQQNLKDCGFTVTTRQLVGAYRDSIGQIAREEGCMLIVAGAPERTVIGSLLDGSAAYNMMQGSPVPLLLIRTPGDPDTKPVEAVKRPLTEHVLFPTDFSDNATRAFHVVMDVVKAGARKVSLLHVQDKAKIDPHLLSQLDTFNKKDLLRLREMEQELKQAGATDVACTLRYGSPTSEILSFISEQQVSWVIMGSQGRGWIREIYLGNVSHNIARHAPVPVLLVPAPRD